MGAVVQQHIMAADEQAAHALPASLADTVAHVERVAITDALSQALGNKARAARALGIKRTTLHEKCRRYGIDPRAYQVTDRVVFVRVLGPQPREINIQIKD